MSSRSPLIDLRAVPQYFFALPLFDISTLWFSLSFQEIRVLLLDYYYMLSVPMPFGATEPRIDKSLFFHSKLWDRLKNPIIFGIGVGQNDPSPFFIPLYFLKNKNSGISL